MIKTILTASILFSATSAFADGYASRQGVVVDVEPVYSTDYTYITQEQCSEKNIPVYGHNQPSSGDVLAGALIGGAIGNQFGSGDGKDAMTVLGAIMGADAAGRSGGNQIVGYTSQWTCELVEVPQETRMFHHYQITYMVDGRYYRVNTDRIFEVGQRITVNE